MQEFRDKEMRRLKHTTNLPILVYSEIESTKLPTFKTIPYDSFICRRWYERTKATAPELVTGLFTRGDPPPNPDFPHDEEEGAGAGASAGVGADIDSVDRANAGVGASAGVGARARARADNNSADKSSDGEFHNSDYQTKRKAYLSLAEDDLYAPDGAPGAGDDGGAFDEEGLEEMRQDPQANDSPASP